MDPFRSELTAAHAKIALLEQKVHHLEHGRPKHAKKRLPRSMLVYFVLLLLLFVGLGALTISTVVAFRKSSHSSSNHLSS